ncbi:TonB-dependent receptor [Vibrio astriarenae]|nr:TonB-dependent receptor [Vibrio sp. C7]
MDAPGNYHTLDFDAAFHYQHSEQHNITFGGGYRAVQVEFDYLLADFDTNVTPEYLRVSAVEKERDSIINAYVQSQYQWNAMLTSVIGVKAEYFQHTHSYELSPRVSAIYSMTHNHSVWAGIGRAVVAPSYMDNYTAYIEAYGPDEIYLSLPNKQIGNEDVWTGELGYRYLTDKFEFDSTFLSVIWK